MDKKLVAGWSFTNMCNLRCRHCYNASDCQKPDELTLEESFRVVDKLKEAGTAAVNFGGGECILRKDFIPLVSYLKKNGIKVSYTSNGTVLDKLKDNLELFDDIGVSIDFADAAKHNWFRNGKNQAVDVFHKAITCLEYLVEKGVDAEIVTCLTKLNCSKEELHKLYTLAKSLGVDYWRLNRFRANGRGIVNEKQLRLSQDKLKRAYLFLNSLRGNDLYEVSSPEPLFRTAFGGRCNFVGDPSGKTSFRIQPNGEVSPSVFLKESGGNIKTSSIEDIMNSPIFKAIRSRQKAGKCNDCKAYDTCQGGDLGASYLAYGHFNGPDPLCWMDPLSSKPLIIVRPSEKWNVHELYLCTLYLDMKKSK